MKKGPILRVYWQLRFLNYYSHDFSSRKSCLKILRAMHMAYGDFVPVKMYCIIVRKLTKKKKK